MVFNKKEKLFCENFTFFANFFVFDHFALFLHFVHSWKILLQSISQKYATENFRDFSQNFRLLETINTTIHNKGVVNRPYVSSDL